MMQNLIDSPMKWVETLMCMFCTEYSYHLTRNVDHAELSPRPPIRIGVKQTGMLEPYQLNARRGVDTIDEE